MSRICIDCGMEENPAKRIIHADMCGGEFIEQPSPKNPAAVKLGRKGGKSTSPAKQAAVRANVAKARAAKAEKSKSPQ